MNRIRSIGRMFRNTWLLLASVAFAFVLLVTLSQLGASATLAAAPPTPNATAGTTLVPCDHWDLAADFRVSPDQENPSRDACGNPNVWYYMTGPESRTAGAYSLLPSFDPSALNLGLQRWSIADEPPSLTYNPSGSPVFNGTETYPPHGIAVHPNHSSLVIAGWRSPISGRVAIAGSVADLNASYGDGIRWFVDKGAANLASGAIPNGGTEDFQDGTGGGNLTEVWVSKGEFLYFIVHRDGTYYCDSTGLDVVITLDTLANTDIALTSAPNPSYVGQPVTFTATVSSELGAPTGDVTFTVDGAPVAISPLVDGRATYSADSLTQGKHEIGAAYAGAGQFEPSASGPLVQTVGASAPLSRAAGGTWPPTFADAPDQENPGRDACGNPDVWYYMSGPESRTVEAYALLPNFNPNALGRGLQQWYTTQSSLPTITYNSSSDPVMNGTEIFPPHGVNVHPGPSSLAVIGWRSPISGRVAIAGSVTDLNPACGDGVRWYIDHGTTNLASGAIPRAGAQDFRDGIVSSSLSRIEVQAGDFVYFAVHQGRDYLCDNTGLRISIFAPSSYSFLPMVSRVCSPLLSDDFSNPASGWPTWDDDIYKSGYLSGEYRIRVKEAGWVASETPGVSVGDFHVWVDGRAASHLDGAYGLMFAGSDAGFYLYEVSDGAFRLLRLDRPGGWSVLVPPAMHPAIRTGSETNRLEVERVGERIALFANGQSVATVYDSRHTTGVIGVADEAWKGDFDARFDNFLLYGGACLSGTQVSESVAGHENYVKPASHVELRSPFFDSMKPLPHAP